MPHYAADVGTGKSDTAFYRIVQARTRLHAGQHCLIDDSPQNVQAAQDAGWRSVLWSPQSRLADLIESIEF